uniref:Uncharacterized protein n=1 Tax=Populus alba TaxID=43335 RepID=A0A4U5R0J8_POPAL|nr:hypothetical protein D5086_0000024270 [Populus alba]
MRLLMLLFVGEGASSKHKTGGSEEGDDPLSQKDLGRKIENAPVNKEALEGTSGHDARNIPPYDSFANTPQEAYPLDRIILSGEWDFLEDIYRSLQAGEVASNAYPTFVCNRIHKLLEIQVGEKRLSCIFSDITHLIKLEDQHSMDGASSARNHQFPSILRQNFSTCLRLSVDKIDLLVGYVFVLTLNADDFQTFPANISRDLRMNPAIVSQFGVARWNARRTSIWKPFLSLELPQPKMKLLKR